MTAPGSDRAANAVADRPGLLAAAVPLARSHDLALLDLDGVVYIGAKAVPGAAQALSEAKRQGMGICFVTNNASRTPGTVADHLTELGVPATAADVLTSAQVAAAMLARRLPAGAAVLVIGGDGLEWALTEAGLVPVKSMQQDPQAVVQGFSPDLGWRQLAEGSRAVRAGLPWIATNLDLTVPTAHGPAPGNGTLVGVIAAATGRQPDEVAGKPRPGPFQEAVRRRHGARPLVIGDRLDTDLEGARAAGIEGLAVLTGVCGASDLLHCVPGQRPDYLGRDLTALLQPHPGAVAGPDQAATGWLGRCRGAEVRSGPGGLAVTSAGTDPLDLLRAACAAEWAWLDGAGPGGRHDPAELLAALASLEPGVTWAR